MSWETREIDFLVIGSGVAGLRAAIELQQAGRVLILAKSAVSEGSTEYAQGGVAVALSDDDRIIFHEQDTLKVGAGLCDKEAVQILVTEGPDRIEELIKWGASFDTADGKLWFSREAAHSRDRIIHSGGDSTGAEIERALIAKARTLDNIEFVDYGFTVDLIVDDGICKGAFVLVGQNTSRLVCVKARATVLATGGAGQVFSFTTNPEVATGDGVAIAFRAGADLVDMEFVQFHPTTLCAEGVPAFLLSEAMRGEGGVLLNEYGERFMAKYHKDGELAPRDVVSQAMASEIKATGGRRLYLDLRHLPAGFVKGRFPRIYETCLGHGLRADLDLLPVHPAAHYMIGGVKSDKNGRTTLMGLFACGEVACAGVHGANRLASNSLLEGVVFGKRAGQAAQASGLAPSSAPDSLLGDFHRAMGSGSHELPTDEVIAARETVRKTMWKQVGIVRDAEGLGSADECLRALEHISGLKTPHPQLMEARNIFYVGAAICHAAQIRTESRGTHSRSDYPKQSDPKWLGHLVLSASDGLEGLFSR